MTTAILFTNAQKSITSAEALKLCNETLRSLTSTAFIFFYFDAVNIIKDFEYYSDWHKLKQKHGLELITCSTAAKIRQCDTYQPSPFMLAGLSEFYSKLHDCDNLVQL